MKVWQDYAFGGTKAFQAFIAAWLIFWGFTMLEPDAQANNFPFLIGAELACAGIYSYFRNKHHQLKNDNNNGGKK